MGSEQDRLLGLITSAIIKTNSDLELQHPNQEDLTQVNHNLFQVISMIVAHQRGGGERLETMLEGGQEVELLEMLLGLSQEMRADADAMLSRVEEINRKENGGGAKAVGKRENDDAEFIPDIKVKHNAKVPLPNPLLPRMENVYKQEISECYATALTQHTNMQLEGLEPGNSGFSYISTLNSLLECITSIKENDEIIAVDLENHSYRSYLGYTCLIQISSTKMDYIIDPLKLSGEIYRLNEIFTNPKIIKVMHGANNDIQWLQRDFGIFMVNLFDTHQAAKVLGYPSDSLSYLCRYFCQVTLKKAYQLADWRIRPLTDDMIKYARDDTQYLIFIYEQMMKLLRKNSSKLEEALKNSFNVSLLTYEKPSVDYTLVKKNVEISNEDLLKELYLYRDGLAKAHDESPLYVLPTSVLIRLVNTMPTSIEDLEKVVGVRHNLISFTEVLNIVKKYDTAGKKITFTNQVKILKTPLKTTEFKPIKEEKISTSLKERLLINGIERRATPSPVLTTDQLFDTAGWRELAEIQKRPNPPSNVKYVPKQNHDNVGHQASGPTGEDLFVKPKEVAQVVVNTEISDNNSSTSSSKPKVETTTEVDEEIPKSIREIYKISNRNRKRNKEKKKSIKKNASADEANTVAKKQRNDTNSTSPVSFMKEIGWVEPNQTVTPTFNVKGASTKIKYDTETALLAGAAKGKKKHSSSQSSD